MIAKVSLAGLVLIAAVSAQQPIPGVKLPEYVSAAPGRFVTVKAVTDGKEVRWKAITPGLDVVPAELLRDSKITVVVAALPGRYRLAAVSSVNDVPTDIAETVVDVAGAVPPGPTPVDPPVPPTPADPTLPADARLFLYLVIDPFAVPADVSTLLDDQAFWDSLAGKKVEYYRMAKTDAAVQGGSLKTHAADVGYPALIAVSQVGKTTAVAKKARLGSPALPATKAGVAEFLKQAGRPIQ